MSQNGLDPLAEFMKFHLNQLESSGVPSQYWPTIYNKLAHGVFDAGATFSLLQVEYDEGEWEDGDPLWQAVANVDIAVDDPTHVYIVDHAWTYKTDSCRQQLLQVPGLAARMAALMDLDIEVEEIPSKEHLDQVMEAKWKFSLTYSVGNADSTEGRLPVWYVMDEFGSRVQHSDDPSFRMVPFIYLQDGCAYSLLFPIKNCSEGDLVTRDYVEGPEASDPVMRQCLLCAWIPSDLTNVDPAQSEPDEAFFASSRQGESLPSASATYPPVPGDRKIRVYAEYEYIAPNLTHPRFEMVDNADEADVIWSTKTFKDFQGLSETRPGVLINQFPYEAVITIKDLLSAVCLRAGEAGHPPSWLPTTYNLKTELDKFVSCFQKREQRGEDNHWIVKPWNLARSLDTQVSRNISHILRLPFSGPKIAQKYLDNPVLFHRPEIGMVKFDIRYIILLRSTNPLKVYAYNRFWLRFANIAFSLDDLDVYEKHFTVMNYNPAHLQQMFCHDFIKMFESQYPSFSWETIQKDIFNMIKSVFKSAVAKPPPCGIADSPQSRAMYATDLMLSWDTDCDGNKVIVPKLLEFNFTPDCQRACDYYPEFFNNVFSTLILDDCDGQHVTLL